MLYGKPISSSDGYGASMMVPTVVYKPPGGRELLMDIYSSLLQRGVIIIDGPINSFTAGLIIAKLIYIRQDLQLEEAKIYINSPGGCIYSTFPLLDIMLTMGMNINTICVGIAASAASAIMVAGTVGRRQALKNAFFMLHQPLGGTRGQETEISIYYKQMSKLKSKLIDFYCSRTSQHRDFFVSILERDCYFSSDEALSAGLIDSVMDSSF